MKTTVRTMQEAAEVLAGKTPYSTVEYRGVIFNRANVVSAAGKDGDISVTAAKRYIKSQVGR